MSRLTPNVPAPVTTDADSVVLPIILSLVVHGAILAFIVISHRIPAIETPVTIETSLVTPQELALMQADIIANQQAQSISHSMENVDTYTLQSNRDNEQQASTMIHESELIFTRSSRPPDEPTYITEPVLEDRPESFEPERIDEFEQADPTYDQHSDFATDENPLKDNDSGRVKDVFSAIENSDPSEGGDSTIESGKGNGGNNSKSEGQIISEVKQDILSAWNPPPSELGKTISSVIKVDNFGNVLSVTTNMPNTELEKTFIDAVYASSPLTPLIDTQYTVLQPSFTVTKKK